MFINQKNYIQNKNGNYSNSIKKIVDLFERNYLLLVPIENERENTGPAKPEIFLDNKIMFKNIEDFKEKTTNKGNLFRCDLLIVDLSRNNINEIKLFSEFIDTLNIDYFILTKHNLKNKNENTNNYEIELKGSSFYIIDSDFKYSIEQLTKSIKLNIILDDLLDDL